MPATAAKRTRKRIRITITPLAVSTSTAAAIVGLSRTAFYNAWSAGKTPRGHVLGRRRLFAVSELQRWVGAGMPPREKFEQMQKQFATAG